MPAIRIGEFDLWRAGYANATVTVLQAGTGTPASLWLDEALTLVAPNPQTLISRELVGVLYGKFNVPLYTSQAYTLLINATDQTGIMRPAITTLVGADASKATVVPLGGAVVQDLDKLFHRFVNVLDYGIFLPTSDSGASAADNTISLNAAIGAVSSGGIVTIPDGTYEYTNFTLPLNVVIEGLSKRTTILQSQTGAATVTINGENAGFRRITLDGVNLQAGSIGVLSKKINKTIFEDVIIKRFERGRKCIGGRGNRWKGLEIEDCTINADLKGNTNGDATGDQFTDNYWQGACRRSITIGVDLAYVDLTVFHNRFDLAWEDNTAIALKVRGARYTDLQGSWFSGNGTNIDLGDFAGGTFEKDNTVLGFWVRDFRMANGAIALAGQCDDVIFERGFLSNTPITLTIPNNCVTVRDVIEDAAVTILGDGTKWQRWRAADHGATSGVTTNAVATKAWSIALEPGQRCFLEGKVIGNSEKTDESGEYWIATSARRPPSTLAYDTQTANFAPGLVLTGQTSGAKGLIVADADAGATGTLSLRNIVGIFVDNEIIKDSATGSAMVNGALAAVNAALLGAVTAVRAAREDAAAWDATFVANGGEIELRVTGEAAKTIDWLVNVDVTAT